MPVYERDDENRSRKLRLAKLKRGGGTFVYDGSAFDTEAIPTVLKIGKKVPKLDDSGLPVINSDGEAVFERSGAPQYDEQGRTQLGGPPKIVKRALKVFKLRGLEFPAGVPVKVTDQSLALKLRCMMGFEELDGGAPVEAQETKPAPKKRGPKPKIKVPSPEVLDLDSEE